MKKNYLLPFLFFASLYSKAQISEPLQELRFLINSKPLPIQFDSLPNLGMYNKKGIHYLLPFYKGFQLENQFKKKDNSLYNELIAEAAGFIGDNKTVLSSEHANYEPLSDSLTKEIEVATGLAKKVSYIDAKSYIINSARKNRVVMINEAHNKTQTRAFTISLLESLFQQGYHYLALEMLDNSNTRPVVKLTTNTGFFSSEPTAGELIRRAIDIGFILVPYEDYLPNHNPNQREYAQAQNLFDFISKKDTSEKMLVVAGYKHIEEGARQNEAIPMAA